MSKSKPCIWEVKVSDGITKFFWDKAEADFYYRDTGEAGLGVLIAPIPLPQTPKEFAAFMEGLTAGQCNVVMAAKIYAGVNSRAIDDQTA